MANLLTGSRILCALALLACPAFSGRFYLLYILGGITDVFDGMAARRLNAETELGARLDTAADTVFALVVLCKLWRALPIARWMQLWIGCIAFIKGVNAVSAFALYRHFAAEHTAANKLCGGLLFALPLCVVWLPRQMLGALLTLSCALATFAAVQEGHYIRTGKEFR